MAKKQETHDIVTLTLIGTLIAVVLGIIMCIVVASTVAPDIW
ncbi:MAG: hypothetical protein ABIK92_21875 [Pseudomonadota bacterium]